VPTGASAAVLLAQELACGGDTNDFLSLAVLSVSVDELLASNRSLSRTGTRPAPTLVLMLVWLLLERLTPAW
jgi:hypothetical protein